jgi:DNA mismatch endonuclease, patch repair protein
MPSRREPQQRDRRRLPSHELPPRELVRPSPAVSRRMALVRQHGTTPELAVRRVARQLGLRYTVKNRDLPGSPDLANRSRAFAVFVHGCYWHRHVGCPRATFPKTNKEFWRDKFRANRARDRAALVALEALGLRSVVIWECETRNETSLRNALLPLLDKLSPRRRPRPPRLPPSKDHRSRHPDRPR